MNQQTCNIVTSYVWITKAKRAVTQSVIWVTHEGLSGRRQKETGSVVTRRRQFSFWQIETGSVWSWGCWELWDWCWQCWVSAQSSLCSKHEDSPAGLGTMARSRKRTQPHIIVLLADDLGWNEVSWNNKLFLTPNLQVRSEDTAQCENAGGRGSNLLRCGEVPVLH